MGFVKNLTFTKNLIYGLKNNCNFAPMKKIETYITFISRIITPTASPEVRML